MIDTLSQSAIDTYQRCARRFYLRYVQGLDWPAPLTSSELDFEQAMRRGEHFHLLIQQHTLGLDVTPMVEASEDHILRDWWQRYLNQAQALIPSTARAQFSEVELGLGLAGVTLVAKFDLVVVDAEGELVIFDWKTGVPRTAQQLSATWQTIVYCFVATECGGQLVDPASASPTPVSPESVRLTYWHAREADQPVRLPYDEASHEQAHRRLSAVIMELKDLVESGEESAFVRTPNEGECRHCPYRSYCERGRVAGPEMEPEQLLGVEESMRVVEGPNGLED